MRPGVRLRPRARARPAPGLELRGAIRAYQEALARDPSGFHALVGLADSWNDLGQTRSGATAADAFHRALGHAQCLDEAFPGRPEGPSWAASAYGNLTASGSPGEKLALSRMIATEARRALWRDPDHAPALVALGIYERELASLGFFARAAARTLLGGLEETSLHESERLLRRALELEASSLLARYELALTLLAAKKDEEARAMLRGVLEMAPSEAADAARQLDAAKRLARRSSQGPDR